MNNVSLKKRLIPWIPYVLIGLFATNLGEAWRLASGTDASQKLLGLMASIPLAFATPLPSFHPGGQLVELILPHREAVGLVVFQRFKDQVHLVLVAVVILMDFHHIQKIHERGKVLLLLRGFLQDKGNQGGVEELFTLLPELVPGFSVSLGVGD